MSDMLCTSVSELMNFPFENFQSFQKAVDTNEVWVNIRQDGALKWASGHMLLKPDPAIAFRYRICRYIGGGFPSALFLVIYSIATAHWWLLLALPLCLVAAILLDPMISRMMGLLYSIPLLITFCTFGWALLSGHQLWAMLTGSLLAIWLALKIRLDIVIPAFRRQLQENEAFLCFAWQTTWIAIIFLADGTEYSIAYKRKDGQMEATNYFSKYHGSSQQE